MRKRTIPLVIAVVAVVFAIAAAVLLRRRAAPEPARLLPEADAYVYVNLKPLRLAGIIGKNPPPAADLDYEQFVRQTGFQFERDLDEAAFAVHAPPRLLDSDLPPREQEHYRRYSEIFVGRIDAQRAAAYLRTLAKKFEPYREVNIYEIPLEGRTVRVALLGVGTAAASNTDGPQVMYGIIDRYKKLALPFGGPALIQDYYKEVPFASSAWGIARTATQQQKNALMLPGGFDLFLPGGTAIVASLRYTGGIHFQAEAFASSNEQAKQIGDRTEAFLSIFRGLEATSTSGADPDVKRFFDSLKVEQSQNRALLTATVPPGLLKKMFSEPPAELTGVPAPDAASPPPQPPNPKGIADSGVARLPLEKKATPGHLLSTAGYSLMNSLIETSRLALRATRPRDGGPAPPWCADTCRDLPEWRAARPRSAGAGRCCVR